MPKVGVGRFYGVLFWPLPGFTSWDTRCLFIWLEVPAPIDARRCWSDRWSHKLKRERRQKFWWKTRPGWFRNLLTFFRFKVLRRLWPFIVSRGSCTFMGSVLLNKVNRKSWTLQPSALNMSIKLGTTNTHRIDLALKMRSCDIICLTSSSILAELSYDQGTFSATWVC